MRGAALVLLLLSTPLGAQSVEERLTRLEEEVQALRAENAELRRQLGVPEPAPAPPPVLPAAGDEPHVRVGGFLHAQAESGDRVDPRFDENDRVYLRRARVNVQGGFEQVEYKAEVDVSGNTLGASGGVRVQATDVYVDWKRYPAAQLRIGQFKTPFSFEQIYSDTLIATPERAAAVDRIAVGRQLGLQLSGGLAGKRVTYAVGAFNGNGVNSSSNDDDHFLIAARLGTTLLERGQLRWRGAVNGYRSEDSRAAAPPEAGLANNLFAGTRHAWGVDTQLTTDRLELMAEYLRAHYAPLAAGERDLSGFYLLGSWLLTPKWQGVARYERYDGVTSDSEIVTGGVNYLLKGNDVKLQLHLMHSDDGSRVVARVQTLF